MADVPSHDVTGSVVQNFDISPDGKRIVFDRLRNHADIVLMNLTR